MPAEHKSHIIVAILGFAGIIVTTVSANWDKWFPPSAPTPIVTPAPLVTASPPETTLCQGVGGFDTAKKARTSDHTR